jgi:hypothetical protein
MSAWKFHSRPRPELWGAAMALAGIAVACSNDPTSQPGGAETDAAVEAPGVERPEGPAARVVGLLSGGGGVRLGASRVQPLPAGWVEEEFAIEGNAAAYIAGGDLPADGRFALQASDMAAYRTRIVVRRPNERADFNGTVVVEWLNVSGGMDANPDFTYLADELLRSGFAWVGVSAQHIGIEGGPVLVSTPVSEASGAGRGLRALDPERYGELHHPGDAFAYDIFSQVARLLRRVGPAGDGDAAEQLRVLGELVPVHLLAVGESQSAFMLTTYFNGVQPLAQQYDGFLIHSRGGGAASLGERGTGVDLVRSIGGPATRIRDDLQVPVLVLQTETDLLFTLNYFPARQPDSAYFRLWEIAGTAHADAYLLGDLADSLGCASPINAGPHHFVAKAALNHLHRWARGGAPPPEAARLTIDDRRMPPVFVRDDDGIVLGGIRTPQVDVPVDSLSGAPAGGSIACTLFGSTTPLPDARIAAMYASPAIYVEAYSEAADAAIAAGFVLEADRAALLADADPSRVTP